MVEQPALSSIVNGLSKRMCQMVIYLAERGTAREQYMDLRTVMALDARKLTSGGHDAYSFEATVFLTPLGAQVAAYLQGQPA